MSRRDATRTLSTGRGLVVVAALAGLVAAVWLLRASPSPAASHGLASASVAGAAASASTLPEAVTLSDLPLAPSTEAALADRDAALRALRQLRIDSRALAYLRQRYVDPQRIDPPAMLQAGLQAVAHRVPEMLVRVVDGPQGRSLQVQMGDEQIEEPLTDLADLFQLNWRLLAAMRFVADHLPLDVPADEVEYVAMNGMLGTLDPYSHMLDPDAYRDMRTHTGGRFGGLGIRILTVDGVLTVVSVIEDSPAWKAGLQANDEILQIDGEDTLNMAIDDAVDRLRGGCRFGRPPDHPPQGLARGARDRRRTGGDSSQER